MAIVNAVASGDYSDFAVTFGGIQPQPGDTVRTSTFIVNLNIDVTGIRFESNSTGNFRIRQTEIDANSGSLTFTDCDFYATGTNICLGISSLSGNIAIRDTFANNTNGGRGVVHSGGGTLVVRSATAGLGSQQNYGIWVTGSANVFCENATGGTGLYSHGLYHEGSGIVNITNVYEGAGNGACGAALNGSGVLNITNIYAGLRIGGNSACVIHFGGNGTINVQNIIMGNVATLPGILNFTTTGFVYVDSVYGNDYGPGGSSVLNYAISGSNTSPFARIFVKKVYCGKYGMWPLSGAVFINPSVDNIVQFRQSPNGATKTLIDSSVNNAVPAQADVRFGTVYQNGDRTGTLRVPTAGQVVSGVLVDNTVGTAILTTSGVESAITNKIPDIVDGVHEANTQDYDDIPGSIGFEFKKLRQANPFIEFEVTDDITPTDTEFAVLITDFHDDGSFQDSVLCFTEGDLTYDNNPILSLVKHTGYSVITLQRPMRVAPEVGDRGIINPLSHVYSIEETQDGLALEATSQSILTAIGEIDVDFAPVETLINVSTQTILAAIAEEDDPTNVVNLQIAIKDQNDIGVAGVYVSIHGTAKSTVTNINGVAELWVNPNTNYNLRFVVPPGYTPLPEENIVVGINDIEEVYVSPQIATPSIPEELCELRIYIKSQGTTEVGSLENIRVNAKLIDDYKIVNQNLFINIIDVAESDENGYVALVLLKDTDYVLSLTRENSIVIKRILIKTTNNAVQTLSEVVNA